ncbi:MAG: HK97-gp10 family putative phage morphogenesis protein [Pseudomonadota bacterium]
MTRTVKLSGFKELDQVLGQLNKVTAKATARKALMEAAEPMARLARANAPKDSLDLSESIDVSTKLTKRQRSLHRRQFRNSAAFSEVFVGPDGDPAAWNQEFGNINHPAQPYLRPAFDQDARAFIDRLKLELIDQLDRAIARARAKAAQQAA